MSKSQRKRRRRKGSAGSSSSPETKLLRDHYQKDGALGIIALVAHFLEPSETNGSPSKDQPRSERGLALVHLVACVQGKLGAGALAAIAEISPDHEVKTRANQLLRERRKQLPGALRRLSEVKVAGSWRLTNEYRDGQVLFLELRVSGDFLLTLAVVTEDNIRGAEVMLFCLPVSEAAETFDITSDVPGGPRRIFEQLSHDETRFETWMSLSRRRHLHGEPSAAVVLDWAARLLDVDVEFPQLPVFDSNPNEDNDEFDVEEVLSDFLVTEVGQSWGADHFDELVDHLRCFEWGDSALRWSPSRVEQFLLFHHHDLEDGNAMALPALLRSWVGHCASVTGQRKPLMRAVLAEIDKCEPRFFADAA